jgi:PAS domain S-box-containing protein
LLLFWTRLAFLPDQDYRVAAELEQPVREREDDATRYRLLVENLVEIVYHARPDGLVRGEFTFISASIRAILGYEPDDFSHDPGLWSQLIHPEDAGPAADAARQVVTTGRAVTRIYRVRHKRTGDYRWLEDRVIPQADTKGRVLAVQGLARDITYRKQVEIELRLSEERYRSLFETSPNPMLVFDMETKRILAVNDAAVENYGYSRDEFSRMTIFDVHPPDDLTRLRKHFEQPPAVGKAGMWRHRKRDGTVFPVEVRGHYMLINQRYARLVLALDVTERIRSEEALRASEAKYRSLIEDLELEVFLKDRQGRYVAANKRFCQGLEKSEAEIIGRTDAELYPATVAARNQVNSRRVLDGGERIETEEQVTVANVPRTHRVVRTPVKDEHGAVTGVLGVCWDVTAHRALEAQVRQAQKMEAIGMLAGGVAHDFNNLLTVIAGNIALALGSLPENHPSRDLLMTAEQAGVQANELTNRLLSFARQTILRPVPTQLVTCMNETVRILRRTVDPRIILEVRTPPDLWLVEADQAQINQVLLNLCLNARDAMPQGGRLVLEAVNVIVDDAYARQHVESRAGEFVRLSVADTGLGIPLEIRGRIFEPFFTTKAPGKGTGLGLSMVFGIVKQHHGWIDFYSESGPDTYSGTRFDIFLPRRAPTDPEKSSQPTDRPLPRRGNETILLADDEPMIRTLARTILERYGYRVLLADDGVEAIQLYEQHKGEIALVILDLTMPRLSGHDALQHLLQIDPHVRVLLASGYSPEHLDQTYHEHIAGFISKPFRPDQLAATVREVLDRKMTK